jgi:hypothetical protein
VVGERFPIGAAQSNHEAATTRGPRSLSEDPRAAIGSVFRKRAGFRSCLLRTARSGRVSVLTEHPTGGYGVPGWATSQAGGGWKMEGFCPVGPAAGSSMVRPGGEVLGRIARVLKLPHWSKRSESRKTVGIGMGTRLEQPGPEQGAGCLGPCSSLSGSSAKSVADEPLAMKASSRLKSSSRSEREETRWLQPAHAERGVQRPWNRSSISAPIPHRPSRSKRMEFITPLAIEPKKFGSMGPISILLYGNTILRRICRRLQTRYTVEVVRCRRLGKKAELPRGAHTAVAPGLAS